MDAATTTNVLAAAAAAGERKTLVQEYIRHHVLYHVADGNPSVWNLPFIRVPALDVFRHDEVMLAAALAVLVGLFGLLYRKDREIPRGWSNFLEVFVLFVREQIVRPYFHEEDARRMAPMRPSIMSLGPTMSAPASACVRAWRTSSSTVASLIR